MRSALTGLILAAACGGSSAPPATPPRPPAQEPAGPPPALLGRPVWDRPLSDPMALRALERVRTALTDPPVELHGGDPRMWLGPLQGWIEKRVKLTMELRADAEALTTDADPRMQLLAAVLFGVAADDFVSDVLAIEPPPEFASGDNSDVTKAVFRETLEKQAAPLAKAARLALQRCIDTTPQAPAAMRVWGTFCRERNTSLGELVERVAARDAAPPKAPEPKPPAMFADCDTQEVRHVDPDAPPPDLKAKPAVAYIYDGAEVKGDDVHKLEQAVAAKLGLEVGMPVVDDKELAAARQLVTQKRLHAGAPVCGQAPPLPAVVANKHKNLIVGKITTTCMYQGSTERCGLFVEYERAGSDDATGLPHASFAKVTSRDVPAAEWIASADRLAADEAPAALLGALSGGTASPIFFELKDYRDEDPWLRVASTLDGDVRARIAECVDAPASFDVSFGVSPTGKTVKTTLKPVTAPPADAKVTACVQKALSATAWPCPLGGKAAKIAVRVCVAPKPH